MQEYGTRCYAYVNDQKLKLDARTKPGVFVGYDKGSPAYLVYHENIHCVKKYRCVTFVERGNYASEVHTDIPDDVFHRNVHI